MNGTYVLASASGLTGAFVFFLVLTSVIAAAIYALLTNPKLRHSAYRSWSASTPVAAGLASLVWVTVFTAIYLTSLAGFHTIALETDGVTLKYAVPAVTVRLRHTEIGDVMRQPAHRMQWRLVIYTNIGNRFESAAGSYEAVKTAWEDLERRRAKPPS